MKLTKRETEIRDLLIMTSGGSKEVAARLGLADSSVKLMSVRLFRKLGVSGRIDLLVRELASARQELAAALHEKEDRAA